MRDLGQDAAHDAGSGERLTPSGSVELSKGQELLTRLSWKVALYATARHWVRTVMNRESRTLVQSVHPDQLSAWNIAGEYWVLH